MTASNQTATNQTIVKPTSYLTIKGAGSFVPEKKVSNFDLAKLVDTSDEWIVERTGIKNRRVADRETEYPSAMAFNASKQAIEDAGLEPNDIDFIINSITVPDYFFPNTASQIQKHLGISNECPCLDVSAACTGFLYALTLVDGLISSGQYKNILVIGTEMTSAFNAWKNRNVCILFGDGCGAMVVGANDGKSHSGKLLASKLGCDSSKSDALILPNGAAKNPTKYLDVANDEHLDVTMDGQQVFKAAVKTMTLHCQSVLESAGVGIDQVDWFIPHQANLRIIEAVGKRFGFPAEKTLLNVQEYANTSSASIPLAFGENRDKFKRGDKILMTAFGAGLTSGAVLIEY